MPRERNKRIEIQKGREAKRQRGKEERQTETERYEEGWSKRQQH